MEFGHTVVIRENSTQEQQKTRTVFFKLAHYDQIVPAVCNDMSEREKLSAETKKLGCI